MNTDEINARAEAATPGPWGTPQNPIIPLLEIPYNAGFIAHAREDISALISEYEAKESELTTVKAERDAAVEYITSQCRNIHTCANYRGGKCEHAPCTGCQHWQWRGAERGER